MNELLKTQRHSSAYSSLQQSPVCSIIASSSDNISDCYSNPAVNSNANQLQYCSSLKLPFREFLWIDLGLPVDFLLNRE